MSVNASATATTLCRIPIIGVGRSTPGDDAAFRARARASLEAHGGVDPQAFEALSSLLQFVKGDYQDPQTFAKLRTDATMSA